MKYKNKIKEKIRQKMIQNSDGIVSANKMKKPRSAIRSSKFNIGKIVNKTSEYDKTMEKHSVEDGKSAKPQLVKDLSVKVFQKGDMPYIKYKGNDIPVSNFLKLSKTDSDISSFVKRVNGQKEAQGFSGTFLEFLTKQYS